MSRRTWRKAWRRTRAQVRQALRRTASPLAPLWLIAGLCLLPLLAALLLRFEVPPALRPLRGQALVPTPLLLEGLQGADGLSLALPRVSGQWLIVHTGPGECDAACAQALYLTRQSRKAQGRHMDRVQRVWLLTDAVRPTADLLAAHPDLQLWRGQDAQRAHALALALDALPALPAGAAPPASGGFYVVDRRGFVVMRYAPSVRPEDLIRELGRLVRF